MEIKTISAKEIELYAREQTVLTIDLRDGEDYRKGHIPGAINIPYEELEQYKKLLSGYQQLLLYCERGNISLLAARKLSEQGYHVINVCGGIHAYRGKLSIDG